MIVKPKTCTRVKPCPQAMENMQIKHEAKNIGSCLGFTEGNEVKAGA